MKYIAYIISLTLFRILALLPRPVLYGISDFLFLWIYYIIGYRKKLARKNLRNAFPEYSEAGIKKNLRSFYHHFCDLFLESAISHYLPARKLDRMFRFTNPEVADRFYDQGRHVIFVIGHHNNWEWSIALSRTFRHQVLAIYKPLHNPYFDRALLRMRERFGSRGVPMQRIARELLQADRDKQPTLTGFVADQRPIWQHIRYWTEFLGQPAPVFLGAEKLAVKFNAPVFFMKVSKVKRGMYEAELQVVTENPAQCKPYEITEKHVRLLEEAIRQEPAHWLWTHNRWKHSYRHYLEQHPQYAQKTNRPR